MTPRTARAVHGVTALVAAFAVVLQMVLVIQGTGSSTRPTHRTWPPAW
ncbi:MAG TPA: hypothetical protein VFO49_05465 [Nocardioides sp.]|nr:hypothetical protein [Nocardioides sp.]